MAERSSRKRTPYVWMLVLLAMLVNLPLLHATVTDAEVDGNSVDVLIVTLVVDVLLLVIGLLLWRFGGPSRPQLRAIAVEDVVRCQPDKLLQRVEGETFLIRGEVVATEPGQVILDVGGRTVRIYLDGHANPVGAQQPAQARARLI